MLLELPAELVQLVLKHSTTPTYIQAALCCRALYRIASSSRDVVLHHLKTNPGKNLESEASGIPHIDTYELFLLLRKRASEHLLDGIHGFDRTMYDFGGKILDVNASSFCRTSYSTMMTFVFKDDDKAYLCRLRSGEPMRIERILECPLNVLDAGHVTIEKTAYLNNGGAEKLAVIVRGQESEVDISDVTAAAFASELRQQPYQGNYYLLLFSFLDEEWLMDDSGIDVRTHICRLHGHDDYKVNALAITQRGDFAISWEQTSGLGDPEVLFHTTSLDESIQSDAAVCYVQYYPTKLVNEEGMRLQSGEVSNHPDFPSSGPITGLKINGDETQLLYTHRGYPVFGYYHDILRSSDDLERLTIRGAHRNYARVRLFQAGVAFAIDIPFLATHNTFHDNNGMAVCRWRYMSIGTATHPISGCAIACLLFSQADCRATSCEHRTNLERGRRLANWSIAAHLCDYPESSSTLGCIFAVSRKSTRIAVSNWDTLYVWALNPREVMQRSDNDFYPEAWRCEDSDTIRLRPIVIPLEAVCFKLMFGENEDTIVALSDRGLMTWDLGSQARGRRITTSIDTGRVDSLDQSVLD